MNISKTLAVAALSTMASIGTAAACDLKNVKELFTSPCIEQLQEPVKVFFDKNDVPYIKAQSIPDAITAQGYLTAQDRLTQMYVMRLKVQGRYSELVGPSGLASDKFMRYMDLYGAAEKHLKLLTAEDLQIFEAYSNGVNTRLEVLKRKPEELPEDFPGNIQTMEPWTPADSMAIAYLMSWNSSSNMNGEIISQALINHIGPTDFSEITTGEKKKVATPLTKASSVSLYQWLDLAALVETGKDAKLSAGSNNWTISGKMAQTGKPLLANDPHIAIEGLPATFYSLGISVQETNAVGVTVPGLPSITVGRSEHVAIGVTNAYADVQDLYLEVAHPTKEDHYLEGDQAFKFETRKEVIKVKKEGDAPGFYDVNVNVRSTHRGPVISDLLPSFKEDQIVSLRWAALEHMSPNLNYDYLLRAKDVEELDEYIAQNTMTPLNFVMADKDGYIAWRVSGAVPVRKDGSVPTKVTSTKDNWTGIIPVQDMPHKAPTKNGWLGTANHNIIPPHYPYYFSNWFAPRGRFERMSELLNKDVPQTAMRQWNYMLDTKNKSAQELTPIIINALETEPEFKEVTKILKEWGFNDDATKVAPTLYHEIFRFMFLQSVIDELGEELAMMTLKYNYLWQDKFIDMVVAGNLKWFDDLTTPETIESRDTIIRRTTRLAMKALEHRIGPDIKDWQWLKVHTLPMNTGKGEDGMESFQMSGSGDTLLRALYPLDKLDSNEITYAAGARMVFDFADNEKVLGVIPGGVSGEPGSPHFADQLTAYLSGDPHYWWLSSEAVLDNTERFMLIKNKE